DQFLAAVFAEEFRLREAAKVQRLIKKARFLDGKSLSHYQWHDQIRFPGHIDSDGLQSLSFIDNRENVVLIGARAQGRPTWPQVWEEKHANMGMKCAFSGALSWWNVWRPHYTRTKSLPSENGLKKWM